LRISVRPRVRLVGAGVPTRPPNINFLRPAVPKFLTMHAFRYLSVRPDVYSKGLARLHPPAKYEPGICDPLQKLLTYKIYSYCISDLINMHEHAYSLFTVNFRGTSVSGPLLSKPPDEDPGLASVVCGNGRFVYSRRLLYAYVTPVTYVEKGAWQPMHQKKRSMGVSQTDLRDPQAI
jgi:hypothetical protein